MLLTIDLTAITKDQSCKKNNTNRQILVNHQVYHDQTWILKKISRHDIINVFEPTTSKNSMTYAYHCALYDISMPKIT